MQQLLLCALVLYLPFMTSAATENYTAPRMKVVNVGDSFTISLPSAPSTGYTWIVRSLPSQVALTGMSYMSSINDKNQVGGNGVTTLYLRAVNTGKGVMKLQYARVWEHLTNNTQSVTIEVFDNPPPA
jgi:inhibitor of cysteine peptidase